MWPEHLPEFRQNSTCGMLSKDTVKPEYVLSNNCSSSDRIDCGRGKQDAWPW